MNSLNQSISSEQGNPVIKFLKLTIMDKTININIAGTLFQIDDIAFRLLRDYLQAINNRFRNVQGGHETVEDIESRIAEIFQSQRGLAGVITKENVEAMISIIGKPEDFDQDEPGPDQKVYTAQRKRMYRNPEDKIIGGVCSGLGAYLETDPVLFRILFVLFTAFFGVGFLIYIVLWIALPEANTDVRKREMFGNAYHSVRSMTKQADGIYSSTSEQYSASYNNTSKIGNAFNEVFRAIGRVCYIFFRIFMIIIGVLLVMTGFLAILTLLMIFVFKLPWAFTTDAFNSTLVYLPDFLNYIVNPSVAPWIIALTLLAIILPLLALIYWGVKMIFWFRAKDGIFSLAGFVLWVLVLAALTVILFNEGISFKETARTSSQIAIPNPPDTLYIMTDHKIADLKFDKRFAVPDDDYTVYLVDSTKKMYIIPDLQLNISDRDNAKLEIRKRSAGRTRNDAVRKSESLIYNYRISRDTLYLDEYFSIPSGSKWTADFLWINLFVPEKTILYFGNSSEKLFHNVIEVQRVKSDTLTSSRIDYDTEPWELGNKFWTITEDGLKETEKVKSKQK
jgi:phage shock protein PspC (stress-responsive transcriptional regulator)